MEIYTIGFAGKSAAEFFGILKSAGIRRLIDIRLNNSSQLAGFTKVDNLPYFLKELCDIDYVHEPLLAPTKEILDSYKHGEIEWVEFERKYQELLVERRVAEVLDKALFSSRAVMLCSESTADQCHRRLVAEYLSEHWGDILINHL